MSQNISEKILSLLNSKIFCLGDLMLDKYVIGTTNRISPEGPIPVLDIKKEVKMLGGVGNVFSNLCTLAVETHLVSLLGNDTVSKEVEKKLDKISDLWKSPAGAHSSLNNCIQSAYRLCLWPPMAVLPLELSVPP